MKRHSVTCLANQVWQPICAVTLVLTKRGKCHTADQVWECIRGPRDGVTLQNDDNAMDEP